MRLTPSVKEKYPELAIGNAVVRNVKVEKTRKELEDRKKSVVKEVQEKYGSKPILEIPEVRAYRDFYKVMGVDPTKVRPPIEYLIRKAMSGSFLSINTLVDSCLLASVQHSAIVSVYDLDKTLGDLIVDLAKGSESFQLIDGKTVTPSESEVLLRDGEKILTAYALGDARAGMVTPETRSALLIAWNAPGIDRGQVEAALNTTVEYVKEFCQGTVEKKEILT